MHDEPHGRSEVDEYEVAEYCGRLGCGKTIVQTAGRGRRREFCSDTCRRAADREYKRAKAMVEHFERYLRRSRHEVAAYGRRAETDAGLLTPDEEAARSRDAAVALAGAQMFIELSPASDRTMEVLRELVDAVTPVIDLPARRASAS